MTQLFVTASDQKKPLEMCVMGDRFDGVRRDEENVEGEMWGDGLGAGGGGLVAMFSRGYH